MKPSYLTRYVRINKLAFYILRLTCTQINDKATFDEGNQERNRNIIAKKKREIVYLDDGQKKPNDHDDDYGSRNINEYFLSFNDNKWEPQIVLQNDQKPF